MSERGTLELLEDIADSIQRILDYTKGMRQMNCVNSIKGLSCHLEFSL